MKVTITEQGKKHFFAIPNFFFLNRLALNKLKNTPGETEVPNIPSKLLAKLRKTIRQMRKIHKSWVFVDMYDPEGTHVIVKL